MGDVKDTTEALTDDRICVDNNTTLVDVDTDLLRAVGEATYLDAVLPYVRLFYESDWIAFLDFSSVDAVAEGTESYLSSIFIVGNEWETVTRNRLSSHSLITQYRRYLLAGVTFKTTAARAPG